ncbi:MAG: dTMP kinase [bacterium]
MFTVALVGGDGAGKTTIARMLQELSPLPAKYLYMGVSTLSSNHALPTSRLILVLKQRSYRRKVAKAGASPSESIPAHYLEYAKTERGSVWTALRLLNRMLEAWYRQIISLWYQLRGHIVICDRHFLFDAAPLVTDSTRSWQTSLDALNYCIFSHLYPKPHLTILLDAPVDVLYARKGEATPEYLDRQRRAYLEQGKRTPNFFRVDATQPLDAVFDDVQRIVLEFHARDGGVCHIGKGTIQGTESARRP